jgi:hypothetical protein
MTKKVIIDKLSNKDKSIFFRHGTSTNQKSQFAVRKKNKNSINSSLQFDSLFTPTPYNSHRQNSSIFNKVKDSLFAHRDITVHLIFHIFRSLQRIKTSKIINLIDRKSLRRLNYPQPIMILEEILKKIKVLRIELVNSTLKMIYMVRFAKLKIIRQQ